MYNSGGPRRKELIDDIGVETPMWGSDYPHGNGVWTESSRYIEEQFGHLPPEISHKIVCENTAKFYGLIPSRILRQDRP